MIEKYIVPGQKIELYPIERVKTPEELNKPKVAYSSKVYDILGEDRIEILMPIEHSRLVLLPVDAEYKVVFFTKQGLYQCRTRVAERYKNNKVYLLVLELTSSMTKYQRREYYRFNCVLPLQDRVLTAEEQGRKKIDTLVVGTEGTIVDISGGGLRFVSQQNYQKEDLAYCRFFLKIRGENKRYDVVGRVLGIKALENQPDKWEIRVCFEYIQDRIREEIIQYIFEEERKQRKKEQS